MRQAGWQRLAQCLAPNECSVEGGAEGKEDRGKQCQPIVVRKLIEDDGDLLRRVVILNAFLPRLTCGLGMSQYLQQAVALII